MTTALRWQPIGSETDATEPPLWTRRIASAYGIRVHAIEGVYMNDPNHGPGWTSGVRGHYCNVKTREVICERGAGLDNEPETLLHELAHVIVQPPWGSISEVCEGFLLMQFERCLARSIFDMIAVQGVIDWQLQTGVGINGAPELGSIPNYTRSEPWLHGYKIAREIGLIDVKSRPTWRLPDWSSRSKAEWRALHKKILHMWYPLFEKGQKALE